MKTSTKNTIITGIFSLAVGVLGTLGITSTVKNEIIINIDGKKVSVDSSEYSTMYTVLEEERDSLKSQYETLESRYQTLESEYNVLKKQLDDSQTEAQSNSDTIETYPTNTIYLMKDCPPYEGTNTHLYDDSDGFKMNGNAYSNGFTYGSPGPSEDYYVLFNLAGKYTSIEFDIGHVDNTGDYDCALIVYCNGNYYTTIEKTADSIVSHETLDVSGIQQLKFEFDTGHAGYFSECGLGNIIATPID